MTMKQTQTKLFDFSDVGLDFSNEAKSLFPVCFKKMFATGYNEKTVASVAITGSQVVLTYGVNHNYAVNRVLKITSGALAAINNGEFVIDSITATTVTLTIDGAPISIAGGFVTKVAPLGWELVFEQPFIHVYKIKHYDDTDRYLRLCFTSTTINPAWRNTISPCIGKSYDAATGEINDPLALQANKNTTSPTLVFAWAFSYWAVSTRNAYTYAEGYIQTGLSWVVGSPYHVIFATGHGGSGPIGRAQSKRFSGFLPTHMMDYSALDYPVLIGESSNPATTDAEWQYDYSRAFIGNVSVTFECSASNTAVIANRPQAFSNYLRLDTFNTITAGPLLIYEQATKQVLGSVVGGGYIVKAATDLVSIDFATIPYITKDIDFHHDVIIHCMSHDASRVYFAMPIEKIK